MVAVNQCFGNSRAFLSPRANGGQLANGAMGNARWTDHALDGEVMLARHEKNASWSLA